MSQVHRRGCCTLGAYALAAVMAEGIWPEWWTGARAVVTLPEQIDSSNADQIRGQLLAAIDRGAAVLVGDMAATVCCDHAGADALARVCQRAGAVGADLRLVVSADAVRRVLRLSGLDGLVTVYPRLAAALADGPGRQRPGGAAADAPRSARPTQGPGADGAQELLDSVVASVLRAGLSLQAAIDLPGDTSAQRIADALRNLDGVVRQVRDHIFADRGNDAEPGQAEGPRLASRERAEPAVSQTASFRERRASLQERVTQAAYSLHCAAAETAVLLEQRAQLLEQPRRIDYPAEIKRWQSFADQAIQMAERWEHLPAPRD